MKNLFINEAKRQISKHSSSKKFSTSELKKTALNSYHKNELKAKMVPFEGYEMPVQYSSIMAEHKACRNVAAVFDVSHMGQVR